MLGCFPCSAGVGITVFKPRQRDNATEVTEVSLLTDLVAWGERVDFRWFRKTTHMTLLKPRVLSQFVLIKKTFKETSTYCRYWRVSPHMPKVNWHGMTFPTRPPRPQEPNAEVISFSLPSLLPGPGTHSAVSAVTVAASRRARIGPGWGLWKDSDLVYCVS